MYCFKNYLKCVRVIKKIYEKFKYIIDDRLLLLSPSRDGLIIRDFVICSIRTYSYYTSYKLRTVIAVPAINTTDVQYSRYKRRGNRLQNIITTLQILSEINNFYVIGL